MLQALGDRFAEATAEWLHKMVRTTVWGYAPSENLNNKELIKENKNDTIITNNNKNIKAAILK